jgi:hypothetical protein
MPSSPFAQGCFFTKRVSVFLALVLPYNGSCWILPIIIAVALPRKELIADEHMNENSLDCVISDAGNCHRGRILLK